MKRSFYVLLVILLATALSGCATLFKGDTQTIPVTADVEGAEVLVDGVSYGKTPIQLQLKTNKSYTITVRAHGKERTVILNNQIGAVWVVLDVLGGLIPVIIDLATGAWYELSPGQVVVTLK